MRAFTTLLAGLALLTIPVSPARSGPREIADTPPWARAIRAMDEAMARGDLRAAMRAREDARLAALYAERTPA